MRLATRVPRILDFDCENRPLSYLGSDFTTPELTVTAWQFVGDKDIKVALLPDDSMREIMGRFEEDWNQADLATGHNVIKHDLRLINAMRLELGWKPLTPKLISDTYADLKKRSPGFASQQTLAEMLGVRAPKVGMSTPAWRQANRLYPPGAVEKARVRAMGDVKQHVQLRKRLLELEWLAGPRTWRP